MEAFLTSVKNIMAIILTLILMPVSFMAPPAKGYEAREPESLKTSFTVLSDMHIEGNNYLTYKEYAEILKDVKQSKNTESLVFLGDNTMNGQDIESIFFFGGLMATRPAKNLIFAPGNHDYGNGEGDYNTLSARFRRYANLAGCRIDKNYYCKIIDGYYFIVLTSESDTVNDMRISDEQLEWLKGVLDEAAKEDKPIFLFNHHPINYIENGESDRISSIVDDYEDVIYFCGHTHWPLSGYSVSEINGVQCVNLPKATERDEEGYQPNVGAVVEVYENEVLLRFRDFENGEWIEDYEFSFDF